LWGWGRGGAPNQEPKLPAGGVLTGGGDYPVSGPVVIVPWVMCKYIYIERERDRIWHLSPAPLWSTQGCLPGSFGVSLGSLAISLSSLGGGRDISGDDQLSSNFVVAVFA